MNGDDLSILAALLYSLSKIEEKEKNMFDIENLRHLLENYLPDDMSFSDLTPDQLTDILANAGIDFSQFSPQELDNIFSSLGLDSNLEHHHSIASSHIAFSRSVQPLNQMADCQGSLPTCGVEGGIENPIQAAYPNVGNEVSDKILSLLPNVANTGLPLETYQHLLSQGGIQSQWIFADPSAMFNTVVQQGCGVVVHGDPHFINPNVFPMAGSYHTVFLSEPWCDASGKPIGFVGIDSAPHSPDQRIGHWTFDQIQKMINGAPENVYKGKVLLTGPMYRS